MKKNLLKKAETDSPSLSLDIAVLALLQKTNRPLHKDALLRMLKLRRREKNSLDAVLISLLAKGKIVRASSGWAYAGNLKFFEGTVSVQKGGVGFVSPSLGGEAIYIHPLNMNEAWDGDTVKVCLLPGRGGAHAEGRIAEVLSRASTEVAVVATRQEAQGLWTGVPADARLAVVFLCSTEALPHPPEKGDLLLVAPTEKQAPGVWGAKAIVSLAKETGALAQERLTKSLYRIPCSFPTTAQAEADAFPKAPSATDLQNRKNLCHLPFVTIDGRTAKDFDDAILVEKEGQGFRLFVAIADVAHYVKEGSALDTTARQRGNSYYFPFSVEPMLPFALSNGLCSLVPHQIRLTMVAEMGFSPTGEKKDFAAYPAYIQSNARLTYGEVYRCLEGKDQSPHPSLAQVVPMLEQARGLATLLWKNRSKRGSLDFDLPEALIQGDAEGNITGIIGRERNFAHRMIEEFMLAANEAVAEFLRSKGQGALFRIHPQPSVEKIAGLKAFLTKTQLVPGHTPVAKGKKTTEKALDIRALQGIMKAAVGTPQEYTINRLLLRAMMQAKYSPEAEGHFGLGSACYCHFTSPIRRYADLIVHRALKRALGTMPQATPPTRELEQVADQINATERTAVEAEREIQKRLTILFLQDKLGSTTPGIISGVTDYGIFVELPAYVAEGMIRLASLNDDYYTLLPELQILRGVRTRRTFALGQSINVTLVEANLARLEITVELSPAKETAQKKQKKKHK